jgi:outer membrane protein assembly factor BamB
LLRLNQWNGEYQYDLSRGFIGKSERLPRMEDKKAGRLYQGGTDRLVALDTQGRLLWSYEDSSMSPDLASVRGVSPRAISGNGRVLLVSASGEGGITPSIIGLNSATGKVLWQRTGILLNAGKVITMNDRFLVIADDGSAHELLAEDGREGGSMSSLTGTPDWVFELPGRDAMLVAENSHYNRNGPSSRVYIRSYKGAADRDLMVPGRVRFASLMPDTPSFVIVSSRNRTLRFALDGTVIWDVETPKGQSARFSPDSKTIVISGVDGAIHMLNTADGKLKRSVDLNFANNITAEKFVKQARMDDVPYEAGRTAPPLPPRAATPVLPPVMVRAPPA